MVWAFLATVAISAALSYFLAPRPKGAKPAGLEEFNIPTAEVGRPIPVLFGTKRLSGPNVVWYGDFRRSRIRERAGFRKVTVGYKYYLGMHMALCHSTPTLLEVHIGDTLAWEGSSGGAVGIEVDAGDKGRGTIDFASGHQAQWQNEYLQNHLGLNIPAFRGVAAVILNQCFLGKSPYIEPWSFLCRRIPDGWQPGTAQIGDDANPAHIIREVLRSKVWGAGYPALDIDDDNFAAVASALHAEGFGVSLVWDQSTSIEDFVSEILKYIDGTLYIDQVTGKFCLTLIREDYDVNFLPLIDEEHVTKLHAFKRRGSVDRINTVTVQFWDREKGVRNSITISDTVLVGQMGGTVSETIDYTGITDKELALFVASRDLKSLSAELTTATFYADRSVAALKVGDPFLWSWPREEIEEMVMRVVAIELQDIRNNSIKVECVQDVFAVAEAIHAAPPVTEGEWFPPGTGPDVGLAPLTHHSFIEAPYFWLCSEIGQSEANALGEKGHLLITGARPGSEAYGALLMIQDNGVYTEAGPVDFSPTARLEENIGPGDTIISVEWIADKVDLASGELAVIGDEIVQVASVGSASLGISRGLLDTVPVRHDAGTIIMAAWSNYVSTPQSYEDGKTIQGRIRPQTSDGTLPTDEASTVSMTFDQRAIRPYRPGNLRANGELWPDLDESLSYPVSVTWSHRDRTTELSTPRPWSDSGGDAETGVGYEYTIEALDAGFNAQSLPVTGTTSGTLFSITTSVISDIQGYPYYRFSIKAKREDRESWQSAQIIFRGLALGPTNLSATYNDPNIELGWTNTTDSDHNIYRSTSEISPGNLPPPLDTVSAGVSSYVDDGVAPGTKYFYRVGAVVNGQIFISNLAGAETGTVENPTPEGDVVIFAPNFDHQFNLAPVPETFTWSLSAHNIVHGVTARNSATWETVSATHVATSWRIRQGGVVVWEIENSSANIYSVLVPVGVLSANTEYEFQARLHTSEHGAGYWSDDPVYVGTTASSFLDRIPAGAVSDHGPGPGVENSQYDSFTDTGFYGEMLASELITYDNLASECSIEGVKPVIHHPEKYFKYYSHGKVLFVSMTPVRAGDLQDANTVSWDILYQVGAVFGTDDVGPTGRWKFWGDGNVIQNKRVNVGGRTYKVRLMTLAATNPTISPVEVGCSSDFGAGSEYNELIYRTISEIPKCDGNYPFIPPAAGHGGPQHGDNWAIYDRRQLQIGAWTGGVTLGQESVDGEWGYRVGRGWLNSDAATAIRRLASHRTDATGWRPVLELEQ